MSQNGSIEPDVLSRTGSSSLTRIQLNQKTTSPARLKKFNCRKFDCSFRKQPIGTGVQQLSSSRLHYYSSAAAVATVTRTQEVITSWAGVRSRDSRVATNKPRRGSNFFFTTRSRVCGGTLRMDPRACTVSYCRMRARPRWLGDMTVYTVLATVIYTAHMQVNDEPVRGRNEVRHVPLLV